MMKGVIAYLVPPILDFKKELGLAPHIVCHAEECCLHTQFVELVEYPRRNLGDGAIVEAEVHTLGILGRNAPSGSRE